MDQYPELSEMGPLVKSDEEEISRNRCVSHVLTVLIM